MTRKDPQPPADPSAGGEPHDVLAAEEFAIGTREERFPPDPTGIPGPHDVLAAEEFAMPAGPEPHDEGRAPSVRSWLPLLVLGALAGVVLARRRL